MTLAEIVRIVARRHEVTTNLAGGFIHEAFEVLIEALDSGEDVKIRGLGTLQWQPVAERLGKGVYQRPMPSGLKLKFAPARRFRSRRQKCQSRKV